MEGKKYRIKIKSTNNLVERYTDVDDYHVFDNLLVIKKGNDLININLQQILSFVITLPEGSEKDVD